MNILNQNLKIYIAGPYTASSESDIIKNVNNAIDAAIEVYKKGHMPYIPHLTHWIEVRNKETKSGLKWEDYMEMDNTWLECCDALLFLGESKGTRIELERAKQDGKSIFHSIKEIPNVNRVRKF